MAASVRPARYTAVAVLTLSAACNSLRAQPDYVLSQILFEPHPIPPAQLAELTAAAAGELPFLVNDPPTVSATAPYPRFSFIDAMGSLPQAASDSDRANAKAAVEAYRGAIVDTEGQTGPFSSELFEQLLGLGRAYQQLDQHTEALATLEKAEFISRVNNGLYAPNQFAVVEQMVETLIASGDVQEAMSKQQYLLYLNTQYYGPNSKLLVPALERLGDWSMQAFENGVQGSTSIGFVISADSGFSGMDGGFSGINSFNGMNGGNGISGLNDMNVISGVNPRRQPILSPRAQSLTNLDIAQRRYYQAIGNLLDSNDFQNAQLLELEEKLQQGIYYGGHRNGLMKDPHFYLDAKVGFTGSRISHPEFENNMTAFVNGRNSLHRTLLYLESSAASDPIARLATLLNLGDWHVLFNRMHEADDYYRQATGLAAALPDRRREWEPLLAAAVPRQLPDFITLPHSRGTFGIAADTPVTFDGYIDLSLSLTRSGDVRHMKVLGKTDNVTPQLSKRLRRLVRSAPYRPTLVDGEPVATEKQLVRYYFADMREKTGI
jgi:hypothetical protein